MREIQRAREKLSTNINVYKCHIGVALILRSQVSLEVPGASLGSGLLIVAVTEDGDASVRLKQWPFAA